MKPTLQDEIQAFNFLLIKTRSALNYNRQSVIAFLIKLFLINSKSLEEIAHQFINDGVVSNLTFGNKQIKTSLDEFRCLIFCKNIQYESLNQDDINRYCKEYTSETSSEELLLFAKHFKNSIHDDMMLAIMEPQFKAQFKKNLNNVSSSDISQAQTLADYVINQMPYLIPESKITNTIQEETVEEIPTPLFNQKQTSSSKNKTWASKWLQNTKTNLAALYHSFWKK